MIRAFKTIPASLREWTRFLTEAFVTADDVKVYTVATLPSAADTAQIIYVSNETGGATLAFSDGTNWRRVQDRAIVS